MVVVADIVASSPGRFAMWISRSYMSASSFVVVVAVGRCSDAAGWSVIGDELGRAEAVVREVVGSTELLGSAIQGVVAPPFHCRPS